MAILWLILLVAFGVMEAVTMGLVSIWFAAGALVALASTMLNAQVWLQITLFTVVSAVTMALARPLAKRYVNRKIHTNADRYLDKVAVVVETIDNVAATGAVSVDGRRWMARSDTGEVIAPDTRVMARRIEGAKLIVYPLPPIPAEEAPIIREEVR